MGLAKIGIVKEDRPRGKLNLLLLRRAGKLVKPTGCRKLADRRRQALPESGGCRGKIYATWLREIYLTSAVAGEKELPAVIAGGHMQLGDTKLHRMGDERFYSSVDDVPGVSKEANPTVTRLRVQIISLR